MISADEQIYDAKVKRVFRSALEAEDVVIGYRHARTGGEKAS
jgi:hypothetical protein